MSLYKEDQIESIEELKILLKQALAREKALLESNQFQRDLAIENASLRQQLKEAKSKLNSL